jgi:hypothetical protein
MFLTHTESCIQQICTYSLERGFLCALTQLYQEFYREK